MNTGKNIKRRFFTATGFVTVTALLGTVVVISTQLSINKNPSEYACDEYEIQQDLSNSFGSNFNTAHISEKEGSRTWNRGQCNPLLFSLYNWFYCHVSCCCSKHNKIFFKVVHYIQSKSIRGP